MSFMINQLKLDDLASKISELPCPECGGVHKFRLKLFQSSSMGRPVVSYGFPDEGTCEGFKQILENPDRRGGRGG